MKNVKKNSVRSQSNKIPLDYIIVSILSNLSYDITTIPTAKPQLHSFFFNLRSKYKILSKVPFETFYYPYSEYVEQAFDNLELSSLINKLNPVMQKYQLKKKELKQFYENVIKSKLGKKDVKDLEKLSKEFADYMH